jgi:amidohydrolase
LAIRRFEELVKGLDQAFGVSSDFENIEGYPSQTNHDGLVDYMKSCTEDILGGAGVHIGCPRMGAEDFSFFCQKWPGAMFGLGCHDPATGYQHPLHSSRFDMDERVLDVGVLLFEHAMVRFLKEGGLQV